MIIEYLKKLTFLSKDEIEEIEKKHNEAPHLREAHKALAREVITDIHGKEEYEHAKMLSEVLFTGNVKSLNSKDIEQVFKGTPTYKCDKGTLLIDMLVSSSIASSKREAREFLNNGAISINGDIVKDENLVVNEDISIDNKYLIVRRGKKKYTLIVIE